MRYSASEKLEIIRLVEESTLSVRRTAALSRPPLAAAISVASLSVGVFIKTVIDPLRRQLEIAVDRIALYIQLEICMPAIDVFWLNHSMVFLPDRHHQSATRYHNAFRLCLRSRQELKSLSGDNEKTE